MYLLHAGTINPALSEGYWYEGHPDGPGIAGRHARFEIPFTRIWVHARSMRYVLYWSSLLHTCDGRIRPGTTHDPLQSSHLVAAGCRGTGVHPGPLRAPSAPLRLRGWHPGGAGDG
ncbi:MAG: hypothetical protein M0P33_08645, partial [Massilibacteroides sp.]|nr:hypothetical protein [Massilibacteroides sp.]